METWLFKANQDPPYIAKDCSIGFDAWDPEGEIDQNLIVSKN